MKINIVGDIKEINKDTIKYIQLLDQSEDFWAMVEIARSESEIPKGGYPNVEPKQSGKIRIPVDQITSLNDLTKNENRFASLITNCHTILTILGLPENWSSSLLTIVILNYIVPPTPYQDSVNVEYHSLFSKNTPPNPFDRCLVVSIKEKMSIKEIVNQLKKQKDKVSKYLNYLPRGPQQITWLNKVKNIDIKVKLEQYKKSGLTLREIGEKLLSEYGENAISFELTKPQLSTYQARFRETLNKLIKNKVLFNHTVDEKQPR